MAYTKEQIIDEIKSIADKLGKRSLTTSEWNKHSSISIGTVKNKFGSWNEAIEVSGLKVTDKAKVSKDFLTISDSELLQDLLRLREQYGKITNSLINSKGKYSDRPYKKRWQSLQKAEAEAIERLQSGEINTIEEELVEIQGNQEDTSGFKNERNIGPIYGLHVPNERLRSRKRSVVGEPLDFRGMRFAPVNEQGVVYLFGMVSQELGFLIESVRVKYPDCEGKRCCDQKANLWEHIYIEFEYKSSNFVEHGHNVEDCDLIVCWIHDWTDCPLEVLELREAIRTLPKKG